MPPDQPDHDEAVSRFWEAARGALQTDARLEDLRALLALLQAPAPLTEILTVLRHSEPLLEQLIYISRLYLKRVRGRLRPEWPSIVHTLLATPQCMGALEALQGSGKMPLRGHYETHRVYVAVWNGPPTAATAANYWALLAHCLLGWEQLHLPRREAPPPSSGGHDVYDSSHHLALLTLRTVGAAPLALLTHVRVGPMHAGDFLRRAEGREGGEALHPIRAFLDLVSETRKVRVVGQPAERKTEPKGAATTALRVPSERTRHDLDPETPGSTVEIHHLPMVDETEAEAIERSGADPAEWRSGVEIAVPDPVVTAPRRTRSPFQRAILARRVAVNLSMANQRLACNWGGLSAYEVSTFLQACGDLAEHGRASQYLPKAAHPQELTAALLVMFWLARRVEDLKIAVPTPKRRYTTSIEFLLEEDDLPPRWWVVPATPRRTVHPSEIQRQQAVKIERGLTLCSGTGMETTVECYYKEHQRSRSSLLFSRPTEVYSEWAKAFLHAVNLRHGTRLTVLRVGNYVFDQIARHRGADLTAAMYLTGRDQFLGRIPSYYTAWKVSRLQEIYRQVCHAVLAGDDGGSRPASPPALRPPFERETHSTYLGSSYCPSRATVRALISSLKTSFQSAAEEESSLHKLARLHANMVRYTAYMIAFGTGYRAVRRPFLGAATLDWETGWAVLSDKDSEDHYHSRLIWVPPVCQEQLRRLREHCLEIARRLLVVFPDLPKKISGYDPPWVGVAHQLVAIPARGAPYLTEAPPNHDRFKTREYRLPFNASRHYLRSNLLERDCPVEVINAFLGHYERGEEPWGIHSGLSPATYRRELERTLVPLLAEDGWDPVSGLGVQL